MAVGSLGRYSVGPMRFWQGVGQARRCVADDVAVYVAQEAKEEYLWLVGFWLCIWG